MSEVVKMRSYPPPVENVKRWSEKERLSIT